MRVTARFLVITIIFAQLAAILVAATAAVEEGPKARGAAIATHPIDQYNVVWTSQSKNSGESMPVGGGDIGLNVWLEDGDLHAKRFSV